MLQFEIGNLTDIGRKRSHNEDYYGFFKKDPEEALAIVADGMGGHASGEIASRMAVEIIREIYLKERSDKEVLDALKSAFEVANFTILQRSFEQEDLNGMGSTATALVLKEDQAFVGHIGDSRAYLFRDSNVTQLTKDHSMVNRMVEQGLLSKEEANDHPQRNVIYKTLGVNMDGDPDLLGPIPVSIGDMFLLCTDGLSNLVDEKEMLEKAGIESPQSVCEKLIELANQRGGHDNITVQVLKVVQIKKSTMSFFTKKKFLIILGLLLFILFLLNGIFLLEPEFFKKILFIHPVQD